jgi:opacity protein-like surface antigen
MKRSSAILALGLVIGLCAAGKATAADLYGGSIKDSYAPMPAASASSLYVRLDGGYRGYDRPDIVEDGIYDLADDDIGSAWSIGGGIGRYFTDTFRADITYDHHFEADVTGRLLDSAAALPGTRAFGLESDVVMFNAYYDFNRFGRFSPYLGVGLGVAHHKTLEGTVSDSCGCVGVIDEGSETHVAGAVMAGLTSKLRGGETGGRNLFLDLGYRFLYLGEVATGAVTTTANGSGVTSVSKDPTVHDIHAHEVRVGLRYDIQ